MCLSIFVLLIGKQHNDEKYLGTIFVFSHCKLVNDRR